MKVSRTAAPQFPEKLYIVNSDYGDSFVVNEERDLAEYEDMHVAEYQRISAPSKIEVEDDEAND